MRTFFNDSIIEILKGFDEGETVTVVTDCMRGNKREEMQEEGRVCPRRQRSTVR